MKSPSEEQLIAEIDYQRFRAAFVDICVHQPDHEFALIMVGADLDRARARLMTLHNISPSQETPPSITLRQQYIKTKE